MLCVAQLLLLSLSLSHADSRKLCLYVCVWVRMHLPTTSWPVRLKLQKWIATANVMLEFDCFSSPVRYPCKNPHCFGSHFEELCVRMPLTVRACTDAHWPSLASVGWPQAAVANNFIFYSIRFYSWNFRIVVEMKCCAAAVCLNCWRGVAAWRTFAMDTHTQCVP